MSDINVAQLTKAASALPQQADNKKSAPDNIPSISKNADQFMSLVSHEFS